MEAVPKILSRLDRPEQKEEHDTKPDATRTMRARAVASIIPDVGLPEMPWDDRKMWNDMKERDKKLDDWHPFGDFLDDVFHGAKRDEGAKIVQHGTERPILVHGVEPRDEMELEKRAVSVPGTDKARLPDYMGGHCGPLGSWHDACPEDYFHALDGCGSGTTAVIPVSAFGVVSTAGILLALATVVVCGYKWCSTRKSKKAAKEADLESEWCGRKGMDKA